MLLDFTKKFAAEATGAVVMLIQVNYTNSITFNLADYLFKMVLSIFSAWIVWLIKSKYWEKKRSLKYIPKDIIKYISSKIKKNKQRGGKND